MRRSMALPAYFAALSAAAGCRGDATTAASVTPETTAATAETFQGTWRSVTPSFEFIRLSVASLSSERGALGARLTLSGRMLDGSGRISGDSVQVEMTDTGSSERSGTLVMRPRGADSLGVRLILGTTTSLTFVRDR